MWISRIQKDDQNGVGKEEITTIYCTAFKLEVIAKVLDGAYVRCEK